MNIEISGDQARISFASGSSTILDTKDFHRLHGVFPFWRVPDGKYVVISRDIPTEWGRVRQDVYLHIAIATPPHGYYVDHKDRDKLNNRRANLRWATARQNTLNCPKQRGKTSSYHGVSLATLPRNGKPYKKPWRIYLRTPDGKRITGCFADEKEAAIAYDRIAFKMNGEFAQLNFPELL